MLVSNKKLCAWMLLTSAFFVFLWYLVGGVLFSQHVWYFIGFGFLCLIIFSGVSLFLLSRVTKNHASITISAVLCALLALALMALTIWKMVAFGVCVTSGSVTCAEPILYDHSFITMGFVAIAITINMLLGVSLLVQR